MDPTQLGRDAPLEARLEHLVRLFGTPADLARAIGVHRAAVFRWQKGERPLLPSHQLKIMEVGVNLGLDAQELAWAANVQRCPCCDCVIDDEIRALMEVATR